MFVFLSIVVLLWIIVGIAGEVVRAANPTDPGQNVRTPPAQTHLIRRLWAALGAVEWPADIGRQCQKYPYNKQTAARGQRLTWFFAQREEENPRHLSDLRRQPMCWTDH
jgi:hypothetical protein